MAALPLICRDGLLSMIGASQRDFVVMARMTLPIVARAIAGATQRCRFVRGICITGLAAAAAIALLAPAGAQSQKAPDSFQTSVPHAILIDADSDTASVSRRPLPNVDALRLARTRAFSPLTPVAAPRDGQ